MTDEVKLLSDDGVAEVAAMFPHAEYQPEVEAMPLCSFCDGAIDDHKANCVVPHVHALCATVRALRAELERVPLAQSALRQLDELRAANQRATTENAALREQLAENARRHFDDARELERQRDELKDQLVQVTQERDDLLESKP